MSRGFLLDTSVISALSPGRKLYLPDGFSTWLQASDALLFIPVIAIAELTQGISKLRRSGGVERADRLETWLDQLMAGYAQRILSVSPGMAKLAGQMSDAATAKGCHPGLADVVIAAMARHEDLVLLTRNLKHFEPLGVSCCDPILQLPK